MISEITKVGIVETGETSTGKILEADQDMNKTTEVEILEVMQKHIKILEDKIVEESTEIIIEMTVIAEVEIGTGLEKDHFLETLIAEEMMGVQVIVGLDQDQGQVQIETESDVTSVENMIILQRIVPHPKNKMNLSSFSKCLI